MGYPMAKNLRKGLGSDKKMLICDVNAEAIKRFQQETAGQGPVEIVANGFEAARATVSHTRPLELDQGKRGPR